MKRFLLATGLAALAATRAFSFQNDVILDDADSAVCELLPAADWSVVTNGSAFRGASRQVDSATAASLARFHANLPASRAYQVWVWHNGGSGFAANAVASVTHAEAAPSVVALNQSTNSKQWLLLGTWWFDAAEEAIVEISTGTAGAKLSADAVRFSPATPDLLMESQLAGVTGAWPLALDGAASQGTLRRATSATTGGPTLTFTPSLPASGDYEVALWLPPPSGQWLGGGTAAATFGVEVFYRGGASQSFTLSLPATGTNEGRWVQVGTAPFRCDATALAGAHPARVVIRANAASGLVPADAMRFTKVGGLQLVTDQDDGPPDAQPEPDPGAWVVRGTAPTAVRQLHAMNLHYGPTFKAAAPSSGPQIMRYWPALTERGLYDVYLWSPPYDQNSTTSTSTSAFLTVHTALGANLSRYIAQNNTAYFGGKWTHAGRYVFYRHDEAEANQRPWLELATPLNPYAPGTASWLTWENSEANRFVTADSILFLRDLEEADFDGDGAPDWLEVEQLWGTNAGIFDTDFDGRSDGAEYSANTNPLVPAPVLTVTFPLDATLN